MTIDRPNGVMRGLLHAIVALVAWFGLLAGTVLLFEPRGAVTLLGPEGVLARVVSTTDARIVAAGTGYMTIVVDAPGLVGKLYSGGAWIVLPPLGRGCSGKASAR